MTVPANYQGLWRRKGIWRNDGTSDLSTQVWWFQSASFHIDLRIPIDRPAVSSRAQVAHLPPALLARFGAQTGFAGKTVVAGERCDWHPEIAFPALSAELDAGWMRFDGADAVHETGIDNSYKEDWVRVADGPLRGVRLDNVESGEVAYLLIGERWMAWACGSAGYAYDAQAPDAGAWSEFTVLRAGGGWRIVASTLPWLEGEEVPAASALESRQWTPGEVTTLPFAPGNWRIAAID